MRINHNISALNAYRNLAANNINTEKSLEKLSSGLRINKASDDAAGLAISEKMRSQIRGLEMAERNALDGISLIQTAEGALSSTHEILQRMRELAVQSANDSYTDTDRGEIQKEVNQLTTELNRIGNSTEFNSASLLDGSRMKTANNDGSMKFQIGANAGQSVTLEVSDMRAKALFVSGDTPGEATVTSPDGKSQTVWYTEAAGVNNGIDAAATEYAVDVSTHEKAQAAITVFSNAVQQVSSERARLGSIQNRLEHTVNNLKIMAENATSSESRIRDLDMAKEMSTFTKNNILNQAAQAMLSQANQMPQGVLQLLK
jgi:flagellin